MEKNPKSELVQCRYGPVQLIQDGKNGYLLPLGNTQNMAEKILEVMQNEDLRNPMGKSAKVTAANYIIPSLWNNGSNCF